MAQVLRMRHLLVMPTTSIPENLSGMDLAVECYKLHSSIQVFQDQAALAHMGPPPPHPTQPPLYAPELRPGSTSSPVTGPQYAYLKPLSLVPSFEPPPSLCCYRDCYSGDDATARYHLPCLTKYPLTTSSVGSCQPYVFRCVADQK